MVFLEHFDEGLFCDNTGRVLLIYLYNFIMPFI